MKKINTLFEIQQNSMDSNAVSRAEVRRIGWHLENLNIVRMGRFQSNFDELVNGKNESNLQNMPA